MQKQKIMKEGEIKWIWMGDGQKHFWKERNEKEGVRVNELHFLRLFWGDKNLITGWHLDERVRF